MVRARIKWLSDGDANKKFFQGKTKFASLKIMLGTSSLIKMASLTTSLPSTTNSTPPITSAVPSQHTLIKMPLTPCPPV